MPPWSGGLWLSHAARGSVLSVAHASRHANGRLRSQTRIRTPGVMRHGTDRRAPGRGNPGPV